MNSSFLRIQSLSFWCVALVALYLLGCTAQPEQTTTAPKPLIHSVIFMDKSVSIDANEAYIQEKYSKAIRDIVEQNLRQTGDKLDIYFIHDNTAKAKALSVMVRSEKDEVEGASPTDRELIETAFATSLQREKTIFLQQALTKLNQSNPQSSNQYTDLWASMSVLSKANESGADVRVYYLSDMIESMQGSQRRDFHVRPPQSQSEAETWAKEDLPKLEQYLIGSPQITLVLPFPPTASSRQNNPHVTHYWQTLFQGMGTAALDEW